MGELIKKIINFFESEKVSAFRKIAIPALVVIVLLSLDNILGISYYWVKGMKIDYIVKIEEAKTKCKSDSIPLSQFNSMMEDAINRRNVFQWFSSLFENSNIGKTKKMDVTTDDGSFLSIVKTIFPTLGRNQLWHTITSSLLWIIFLFILLLILFFSPFFVEKDRLSIIMGMLIGIGLLVFLIWLTQWLFGLIPVILGRAYINYIIQLLLNLIPISILTIGTIKEVKKKKI